jgi:hypothetical protein
VAQLVREDQTVIISPWMEWLRVVLVGAALGIFYIVITFLLSRYVVEPLACREAVTCLNATPLAGNIAAVLTAVLGIFVLVRFGAGWPLIIAVAAAALLWDLAAWTAGLWWLEVTAWAVLLYALAYGLFAWIGRSSRLVVVAVTSLVIVVIIRILLVL